MVLFQDNIICAHLIDVSCKKQLFAEVASKISKHIHDEDVLAEDAALLLANQLIQRERLGSTAIGRGIALPHIISADIPHMICCIATVKRPINFDATDGRAVDLFGILLLPEADADTASAHLEELRQRLTQRGLRSRLKTITSSDELKHALSVSSAPMSDQPRKSKRQAAA